MNKSDDAASRSCNERNLCGASAIETEIAKRTDSQSSIRRERMTRRSSLTSVMTLGQFGEGGLFAIRKWRVTWGSSLGRIRQREGNLEELRSI
jgi:hypothetical protein